jgi:RNA polymerase subunit RPABC4/transcription elongation factor Spt4
MRNPTSHEQFSIKDELKIIHKHAWWALGLLLLAWFGLAVPNIVRTVPVHPYAWGGGAERIFLTIVMCFVGFVLGLWLTLVFYVNVDAKRRHMSRVVWTLLVLLIPYGIGFLVYFFNRQPIPKFCPQCQTVVGSDFLFCPVCRFELKNRCANCQHAVETGWHNCPYCGAEMS